MTKEPTNEQIREFWKWCGFRHLPFKDVEGFGDGFGWVAPDWEYGNGKWSFCLPPIDLNNLFKYAVPKEINRLMDICDINEETAYEILFDRWLEKGFNALALFWALDKVKEVSK